MPQLSECFIASHADEIRWSKWKMVTVFPFREISVISLFWARSLPTDPSGAGWNPVAVRVKWLQVPSQTQENHLQHCSCDTPKMLPLSPCCTWHPPQPGTAGRAWQESCGCLSPQLGPNTVGTERSYGKKDGKKKWKNGIKEQVWKDSQ